MNYQLEEVTIEAINATNNHLEEEQLDGVQGELLAIYQRRCDRIPFTESLGLVMPWTEVGLMEEPSSTEKKHSRTSITAIDIEDATSKIVDYIQSESDNINDIIDLIANLNAGELKDVLSLCCQKFQFVEQKRSFLVAMSATRNSTIATCSQLLLPQLANRNTFLNTLDIYGPVLKWFESNAIEPLVVPLLKDEASPLLVDIALCKAFCNCLSDSQKNYLLNKYSNVFNDKPSHSQMQALGVIIETTSLDISCLPTITNILSMNISSFSDNRLMGKIILTVLTALTPPIPAQSLNELTNLVECFKGPLRFRHQHELKKLSEQTN